MEFKKPFVVTRVKSLPIFDDISKKWKIKVEAFYSQGRLKTSLLFSSKEEAENIFPGYKFMI